MGQYKFLYFIASSYLTHLTGLRNHVSCLALNSRCGDFTFGSITALDQNICTMCKMVETLASDCVAAQSSDFAIPEARPLFLGKSQAVSMVNILGMH